MVAIAELIVGINAFLAGSFLANCPDLDQNVDGAVQVSELILAVRNAVGSCRLGDDAVGRAVAEVAVATIAASQLLDGAATHFGGRSAARSETAPAGLSTGCPGGGTRHEVCTADQQRARLDVVYDQCRTVTSTTTVELDGRYSRTVDDPHFCDTQQVADDVSVSDTLTDLDTIIVTRDGRGTTTNHSSATFTRRLVFNSGGCDGREGTYVLNGESTARCETDRLDQLGPCPSVGRDVTVVARNVQVVRDSSRATGSCTRIRTITGQVELYDRIAGHAFDARYRDFVVRHTNDQLVLRGALELACVGEMSLRTELPLRLSAASRCPREGNVVAELGGISPAVRYRFDGYDIDVDGDGSHEHSVAGCENRTLEHCQ